MISAYMADAPFGDGVIFVWLLEGIVTSIKACGVLDGPVALADEQDQLFRLSVPSASTCLSRSARQTAQLWFNGRKLIAPNV